MALNPNVPAQILDHETAAHFAKLSDFERDSYGLTLAGYTKTLNTSEHVLALLGARRFYTEVGAMLEAAEVDLIQARRDLGYGVVTGNDVWQAENELAILKMELAYAAQNVTSMSLLFQSIELSIPNPDLLSSRAIMAEMDNSIALRCMAHEREALRKEWEVAMYDRETMAEVSGFDLYGSDDEDPDD